MSLRRRRRGGPPALEGLEPHSREFGYDRGKPIDRWYIERFLTQCGADVRGRVLEIAEPTYTEWYGGGEVTRSDVLFAAEGNPAATIVGDLVTGDGLPEGAYDCFICTQTLHVIWDVHAAVRGIHRVLAPGGVALVTVPALSQTSREDARDWGDWWRFTSRSTRRLFADVFGSEHVEVEAHGNVRAAAAFLYGLAAEELEPAELERFDPEYELVICVRARR